VGGDCRFAAAELPVFFRNASLFLSSSAALSLSPTFLLRSLSFPFDHSSPSPLEAARLAVSLVSESTACVYRRLLLALLALPIQTKLDRSLCAAKISSLIDHCINNNSTIIVIYRDALAGTPLQREMKGRHMQRKVYPRISITCGNTHSIFASAFFSPQAARITYPDYPKFGAKIGHAGLLAGKTAATRPLSRARD